MRNLFITGTDTNIGKTFISAALTQEFKCAYWKPIQSGLNDETDTEFVKRVTSLDKSHFIEEAYKLKAPRSPHESAEKEGISIEFETFNIPKSSFPIIIEGAGGLLVPINKEKFIIDLIDKWEIGVILVARTQLGTINHTLLSIEALKHRKIRLIGIILNGEIDEENLKSITHFSKSPVLGMIPQFENITSKELHRISEYINLKPIQEYLLESN